MSDYIHSTLLTYPALMQAQALRDKNNRQNSTQVPKKQELPIITDLMSLVRNVSAKDRVCFSGNTPSSEGKARASERAYQRVQSHPKASQEDKEYFQEVSDQQQESSSKARKYGTYSGITAGALTSVKGAALTSVNPSAGLPLAMAGPVVSKQVSDRVTNFLHDKVFDQSNYAGISEFQAQFDVVEEFLDGKTSVQDGSAYTFDKHGQCHEIRGISKTREQQIQKEFGELIEKQLNGNAGFMDDYHMEKIRNEVKRHMVTT